MTSHAMSSVRARRAIRLFGSAVVAGGLLVAALVAFAPAPAQAQGSAGVFTVDTVHSSVMFRVFHYNTTWFYGRFNNFTGSLSIDAANPANSSMTFEVAAETVDTGNAGRDKHLRSPDFFNTAQFPTVTFQSTSVKHVEGDRYEVAGNFTMHGVSKPMTISFVKTGEFNGPQGYKIGGEASFAIKRSEFGMTKYLDGIGDDVTIVVSVEAAAAK